jgi:hypothetical protein
MLRRSLRWAAGLALGLTVSSSAWAADDAEPIRVELHAQPACANGAEFLRAVIARTARVRSAADGEAARTFHVSIVPTGDKLSGDFSISEAGSEARASDKRSIVGESCREVFDALTLFAALAVDPQALTTTTAEPIPADRSEPAQPQPSAATAPTPLAAPRAAPTTPERKPFQAGVGCDIGAVSVDTGSSLLLIEPFAEARLAHREARLALAPTVRLGFSSLSSQTASTVDGPAKLRWTTLRLDGCPAQLQLVGSLVARPCLALGGGALKASGETIAHPESHTLGWWTLGALFRLEWSASRLLSFEASAALDGPVRRDTFYFDPESPETRVYRAPSLLGRGELGIGLHFL